MTQSEAPYRVFRLARIELLFAGDTYVRYEILVGATDLTQTLRLSIQTAAMPLAERLDHQETQRHWHGSIESLLLDATNLTGVRPSQWKLLATEPRIRIDGRRSYRRRFRRYLKVRKQLEKVCRKFLFGTSVWYPHPGRSGSLSIHHYLQGCQSDAWRPELFKANP